MLPVSAARAVVHEDVAVAFQVGVLKSEAVPLATAAVDAEAEALGLGAAERRWKMCESKMSWASRRTVSARSTCRWAGRFKKDSLAVVRGRSMARSAAQMARAERYMSVIFVVSERMESRCLEADRHAKRESDHLKQYYNPLRGEE